MPRSVGARLAGTWLLDALLAAGLLAAMVVERAYAASAGRLGSAPFGSVLFGSAPHGAVGVGAFTVALVPSVAVAGGLLLRRWAPLAGFLIGSVALPVEALFVAASAVSPYANLIAVYSLGLHATRRRAWWGPPVVVVGLIVYFAGTGSRVSTGFRAGSGFQVSAAPLGVLFVWLLAWAVGYTSARRREERETARLLLRRQVVAEERQRLARELHDLIGHTVTVMVVQAGAARRVLDRDPAHARNLLTGLERTGRDALDELDRMLALLRPAEPHLAGRGEATVDQGGGAGDPDDDRPGLAELDRLTDRLSHAGVQVTVRLEADALPRTVDMSVYRIVQEALTNAVKHGRAGSATVTVRRTNDALTVEIRDDGVGPQDQYAPGRGLLGITERVAMLGGTVQHGPAAPGFRIRATLPLPVANEGAP